MLNTRFQSTYIILSHYHPECNKEFKHNSQKNVPHASHTDEQYFPKSQYYIRSLCHLFLLLNTKFEDLFKNTMLNPVHNAKHCFKDLIITLSFSPT